LRHYYHHNEHHDFDEYFDEHNLDLDDACARRVYRLW
jgi:hypothetical protein